MSKYQKKTIRKAPPWLRNSMKIANDLDTQLNRLRKEIETQMEIAKEIADTREQNAILSHQLSRKNTSDPTKPTDVDVVLTSGEPEEELPDFSQPPIKSNKLCWCVAWKQPTALWRETVPHKEGCPNAPDTVESTPS